MQVCLQIGVRIRDCVSKRYRFTASLFSKFITKTQLREVSFVDTNLLLTVIIYKGVLSIAAQDITRILIIYAFTSIINPLAITLLTFNTGHNVQPTRIKSLDVPSPINDIEPVQHSNHEPRDFEVEPVSVAASIGVYFHYQVVFVISFQVGGVEVTALKVLIKLEHLILFDFGRELGVYVLF